MLPLRSKTVLAIDTSTVICSVALSMDGTLYVEHENSHRNQLATLLPAIRRVCAAAQIAIRDIALCVCSRGPGSFVGLRIALNVVKGFYAGCEIPFVTIPTHQIYGHAYRTHPGPVIAVIMATKTVFYVAAYYQGQEIIKIQEMNRALLTDSVGWLMSEYQRTPLITSVDDALLADLAGETRATMRALASSAAVLCEMGQRVYARQGAEAVDSNPDYVRAIAAERIAEIRSEQ